MIESYGFSNIAIIKYWGKKDDKNIFPSTNSISFCLKDFYTKTTIKSSDKDVFYLNNEIIEKENIKIFKYIDEIIKNREKIEIRSYNNFYTSAGLSSSSSGISALTKGINEYFKLNLSLEEILTVSRKGSGSSCRSYFKGITVWKKNNVVFNINNPFKMKFLAIILDGNKKKISSREAMKLAKNESRIFNKWVKFNEIDYRKALISIRKKDFKTLGDIAIRDFILMHKTNKYVNIPFSYITKESEEVISYLKKLRIKYNLFYTMDAGSNVKVFILEKDYNKVYEKISKKFFKHDILRSDIL